MSRRCFVLALALIAGCARGSSSSADGAVVDTVIQPRDATVDSNGCATQPCSILPQCGCNGASACDYDASDDNGTACRSILTPGTETMACSAATDCERGFVCVGGASFASCKKYCSADADCGSPRGQCVYTLTANNVPVPDIPQICSSNCEPTDTNAAGCPSTYKCTLYTINDDGTDKKIADCSPAGTRTQGQDCTSLTNGPNESLCAKGYQCVKLTTESTYKCRRICQTPAASSAGCGGQQCIGYQVPHTIGGTTYGICAP